jgi:hypothetical protein
MKRISLLLLLVVATVQAGDKPMVTRWAKDVTADKVHPEYPRPQFVRKNWQNLNGQWDYAIRPKDEKRPEKFDGKILVPFAVESTLSGVGKRVGDANRLWYRRTFMVKREKEERVQLNFGAVDWHAIVWLNGKQVGEHKGAFDPFSFDITDALKEGEQEIVVSVWDPSDKGFQPRGKQVANPGGIFYTPVTGIWQTVWLERVPSYYIHLLTITPNVDAGTVTIDGVVGISKSGEARVRIMLEGKEVKSDIIEAVPKRHWAHTIALPKESLVLWSPDRPALYDVEVTCDADRVTSYFAMRKIEVKKDGDGFNRLFLNNKPLFQYGPLDQGWWPDGLYTAPTDEALKYDLEVTKKLGFNMIRKHVKVEPDRWYYHCDKLGILVWQDMPNGDRHIGPRDPDIKRSAESSENYYSEWGAIMDALRNHPCIVVWVPFNEGWGQFDTNKVLEWTMQRDPTRLVDGPSGWADRGGGHMHDMHNYPNPNMPKPEAKRAVVLGEFGGLGLPLEGHLWQKKDNWGYRTFKTRQDLQTNYEMLMDRLHPLIGKGLSAAVYTQTTDVEGEVNGLMTYDREVIKVDADKVAKLHRKLYLPPPIYVRTVLVPTSEEKGQTWRYTTKEPAKEWTKPDFDDASWSKGEGGFGTRGTPGAIVQTTWDGKDIWLRRTFELKDTKFNTLRLRLHHDEDVEVYVNGQRIAALPDFSTEYFELTLGDEARKAFRAGTNTLAVHCKQTVGGQYIDVGFVDVEEKPR